MAKSAACVELDYVLTAAVVAWQLWGSYGQLQLVLFTGPLVRARHMLAPAIAAEIAKNRDSGGGITEFRWSPRLKA